MGAEFGITIEDIRDVLPKDMKCPALGVAMEAGKKGRPTDVSPTLDRLNNDWGYVPGNIAVISYAANRAKGGMCAAELERIAAWMRAKGLA